MKRTQVIHQALVDQDLPPSEHSVDSAYVSAEHLVSAQNQQSEMVSPTRKNASWQSKIEDGYDEARFNIDWATETVTCREGKASKSWKPRVKLGNRAYVQVRFSRQDCSMCDAKERSNELEKFIAAWKVKSATSVEQGLKERSRKVCAALACGALAIEVSRRRIYRTY